MQNRSSSASPTEATEPQQDTELWFSDGNVVIVAGKAAFRVHSGVLSRHSEIFHNMFGVPQPPHPTPSDMLGGCPVVHVSDTGYDFKQMLHTLYDGAKFMPPDKPVDFSILAALARLGHKYHIEWVLAESMRRLKTMFAGSFERWSKNKRYSNEFVTSLYPPRYIEALNLFKLIGETSMLPLAVYECCRDLDMLYKGAPRDDGMMETVDRPTLQLCVIAHRALFQRQAQHNAKIFAGLCKGCSRRGTCRSAIEALYKEICADPNSYLQGNPMDKCVGYRLETMVYHDNDIDICGNCSDMLEERELQGRKAIWADLPKLTGIVVDHWNRDAV